MTTLIVYILALALFNIFQKNIQPNWVIMILFYIKWTHRRSQKSCTLMCIKYYKFNLKTYHPCMWVQDNKRHWMFKLPTFLINIKADQNKFCYANSIISRSIKFYIDIENTIYNFLATQLLVASYKNKIKNKKETV